jgi:hypothetical protein
MNQTTVEPGSLIPAALSVAQTAPEAQTATLKDLTRAHTLFQGWASRAAINSVDTGRLWSSGMYPLYLGELADMSGEALQRYVKVQQDTLREWAEWNRQRAQINGANTMTKLLEQEMNLLGRIGLIVTNHMTNLLALQENVEVAYAYWLSKKLGPASLSQVHVAAQSLEATANV